MHTATRVVTGRLTARFQGADMALQYCRYPGPPCLGVADSAAVRTMLVAAVNKLEISPGSHWRRGALIGGVFGAVAGGLVNAFLISSCESHCGSKESVVVLGGLSGGIFFGGLGALWGSAFPRWGTGW